MFTALKKGRVAALGVIAVSAAVALAGCSSSSSPLDAGSSSTGTAASGTIVVGSQSYYSNEIIAEIYSQALEANGLTVTRKFNIGQRDAYLPALESGEVTLFPEYSGNLLQYYDKTTTATSADDVFAGLAKAVPSQLEVLQQSQAADQDSYNVTKAFSDANAVKSIADLAKVSGVTLGGNAELATRPYGPPGLQSTYGVTVGFTPIDDSAGPLTLKALLDNTIQVANIYSADPSIGANNLVTLSDPKHLFLASNVIPLINKSAATPKVTDVINKVDAALTTADLVSMNGESTTDQKSSADIAKEWLAKVKLF
ncbi:MULTISPECIES: ABC transporter substrate-binding protein [Subtercola]|uniref:Glycine/betaine ABC transporter n=1 Tax=Subtercola vilae TaxID=2056433 RepID=A0A4T2BGA5_9MICO|nr:MULTISPECIES: ABC transporter substrate-binding protein [Subtercola]MEA9985354.1 glycine betaine ABC transporter substrate-binding protein [Subtercola sp. RTI3]TIH28771.1 glycine/betaine ABC transporter [Subtercola vilae]